VNKHFGACCVMHKHRMQPQRVVHKGSPVKLRRPLPALTFGIVRCKVI
jgi:hypothetical protein